MLQLNDSFLEEIGLGAMPKEQRPAFLQHVYEQLEMRVGTMLSDGMTEQQMDEFETIIDRKPEVINRWINDNIPDFINDPLFQQVHQSVMQSAQQQPGSRVSDDVIKAEYAATKWLEVNRPDYRDVVNKTLEVLKKEISQNKDAILGS